MLNVLEIGAEREKWMAAILQTLREFSPGERGVFTLSRYYSYPLPEISRKLSLPIQEIESLLRSAEAKLARNLKYSA